MGWQRTSHLTSHHNPAAPPPTYHGASHRIRDDGRYQLGGLGAEALVPGPVGHVAEAHGLFDGGDLHHPHL